MLASAERLSHRLQHGYAQRRQTSGTGVAPTREWPRSARAAVRSRRGSAAIAARGRKRRVVNLLQRLARLTASAGSGDLVIVWPRTLPETRIEKRVIEAEKPGIVTACGHGVDFYNTPVVARPKPDW